MIFVIFSILRIQGKFERELRRKDGTKFKGTVIVHSEEILDSRDHFSLQMVVSGLSGGFFSSPQHFLEVRRADETGAFVLGMFYTNWLSIECLLSLN